MKLHEKVHSDTNFYRTSGICEEYHFRTINHIFTPDSVFALYIKLPLPKDIGKLEHLHPRRRRGEPEIRDAQKNYVNFTLFSR